MTNASLRGKADAGNPHYTIMSRLFMMTFVSALFCVAASGETYTWVRKLANGTFDNGDWETLSNWTLEGGAAPEAYPGSGDVVVLPGELENGQNMRQLRMTASADGRVAGTVQGGRGYEILLAVPRNGAQSTARTITIENPNGFAGAWHPEQPRTTLLFENDSTFTPRLATLETQARAYVNVANEGARVKVGLLKAKNDYQSYNTSGGTRYRAGGALQKMGLGTLEIEEAAGIEERIYVNQGAIALDGRPKPSGSVESILSRAWLRLDATLTNSMSLYTGADGRTYVTNWPDANGSGRAARRDKKSNFPTYSADFITEASDPFISPVKSGTGLPLVDFGAMSASLVETLGPQHGLLRFDGCTNVRELFIVRWRTDPNATYSSLIGHHSLYPLHCNGNASLFSTAADKATLMGEVRLNGVSSFYGSLPVDSYSDGLDTMHLLNVAPTNAISLDLLGSERYFSARTGGCRIGEVLIFTEKLTEAERAQVNEYLMAKWFKGYVPCDVGAVTLKDGTSIEVPEGRVARVRRITLWGDTLVKTGGGTLVVDSISPANAKLDIRGGDVRINPDADYVASSSAPASSPFVWLDATAVNTLTFSNSEDNTASYLTNWTDKAGGSIYATIPWGHKCFLDHYPTVKQDIPSAGLAVVDFSNNSTGYSSWMWLSTRGRIAYEGFIVYRHVQSTWGNIFGSSSIEFMRNAQDVTGRAIESAYAVPRVAASQWTRDGAVEDPFTFRESFVRSGAFSLIAFAAPEKVQSDLLAKDRLDSSAQGVGGMQIGEMILYDRRLTDAERRDTEAYLMKKWLGKDHPEAEGESTVPAVYEFAEGVDRVFDTDDDLSVAAISGGTSTFVKRGVGAVTISPTCATREGTDAPLSFVVEEGSLAVTYDYPVKPLFHFDASVDSFEGVYEEDGKTYFTRWNDPDDPSVYATTLISNSKVVTNATLVTVETASGVTRRVADFGAANSATTSAGLAMSKSFSTVRDAFTIHADRDGNQCLFGHSSAIQYLRGWSAYHQLIQRYNETVHPVSDGYIAVDSVEKAYNYVLPAGFHLVNFAPTNNTSVNRIALDRTTTGGGCRIGEQVAFSETLATNRRAAVTSALMAKWFESRDVPTWTNSIAEVALDGGSLSIACADDPVVTNAVFVAADIEGHGGISAAKTLCVTGSVAAAGGALSFNGNMSLADGAELKVSFAEDGTPYVLNVLGTLSSGAVRVVFDEATVQFAQPGCSLILSAGVFVGVSPLAWTVDRSAFMPRRTAHLRFPGGEVYLDVAANGTLMMFR